MHLADIDYALPAEAVAQVPLARRDAARLLVDRGAAASPEHRHVRDLPSLLEPGDLVVVNDTKVLPARLRLRRATGGQAELLLLERRAPATWEALVKPARKLKVGEQLAVVGPDGAPTPVSVVIGERTAPAAATFEVTVVAADPDDAVARFGEIPLPPYITTPLADPDRYQTVFAARPASSAAPTAGLHLTAEVLDGLSARGIEVATVELVVGLGTFKPIEADDPADHVMHAEAYRVSPEVLAACRGARRVVAIGTTVARALESAAMGPLEGHTTLFIRRPYPWQVVDVLLTNFHLPRSSLLLLVDAFVGPRWRQLYELALAEGYRFLSFGDAMLLERAA